MIDYLRRHPKSTLTAFAIASIASRLAFRGSSFSVFSLSIILLTIAIVVVAWMAPARTAGKLTAFVLIAEVAAGVVGISDIQLALSRRASIAYSIQEHVALDNLSNAHTPLERRAAESMLFTLRTHLAVETIPTSSRYWTPADRNVIATLKLHASDYADLAAKYE